MTDDPKEMKKRKLLEMAGCLLYIIAFLVMGAVFLVRWVKVG